MPKLIPWQGSQTVDCWRAVHERFALFAHNRHGHNKHIRNAHTQTPVSANHVSTPPPLTNNNNNNSGQTILSNNNPPNNNPDNPDNKRIQEKKMERPCGTAHH